MPRDPEKYYLGEDDANEGDTGDKTIVLDCDCGSSGCWPLLCKIGVGDETVIWKDFEQPHRRKNSITPFWDYARFGPFIFSKEQYLQALARVE